MASAKTSWVALSLLTGCAASVPNADSKPDEASCAPGTICASIGRGVMGEGDSICALDKSRRFLDVKLVADCPTKGPLVLTVRNADPYDRTFQPVEEKRAETLSPNVELAFQTRKPLALTARIKQLLLQVQATCEEGDDVVMRYGDARCEVPPVTGSP